MFIISQLILKFWFAKFIFSYSSSASKLAVTIDVSYTKPSDFFMDPPNYRAGSSITLTCRVEGVTYGLMHLQLEFYLYTQLFCQGHDHTKCDQAWTAFNGL